MVFRRVRRRVLARVSIPSARERWQVASNGLSCPVGDRTPDRKQCCSSFKQIAPHSPSSQRPHGTRKGQCIDDRWRKPQFQRFPPNTNRTDGGNIRSGSVVSWLCSFAFDQIQFHNHYPPCRRANAKHTEKRGVCGVDEQIKYGNSARSIC